MKIVEENNGNWFISIEELWQCILGDTGFLKTPIVGSL